jgi:ribulose-bisphosphate carboxylase large chain
MRPTAPTAAGRIGVEDVKGLARFYGRDVVFILGSRIQQDAAGVEAATQQFMKEVERCTSGARSA